MIDNKEIQRLMIKYKNSLEDSDDYKLNVASVLNFEGNELFSNKEYGKSIKYYDEAILKNPNEIYYIYNKAVALHMLNKYDETIDLLDKCLEIDPYFQLAIKMKAKALGWKGVILYRQDKYKEALKYFDNAMEINPDTKNLMEYRTKCSEKINSLELNRDESSEINEIRCENCGSNNFIKTDGIPTCKSCGTKYPNMSLDVIDKEKAKNKRLKDIEIDGLLNPHFPGNEIKYGGRTVNGNEYSIAFLDDAVTVEPRPGILSDDEILKYAPKSKAAKKIRKKRKKGLFNRLF